LATLVSVVSRGLAVAIKRSAVAVYVPRCSVAVCTQSRQRLFPGACFAGSDPDRDRNIASATRILDAIKERRKAGTGTDLDVAQQESVLANQKALVPPLRQTLDQNVNALAVLVSRPPESLRVTGGSLHALASPRVTPGLPSGLADAAAGHPPPGSAACLRHRQYPARSRAVLSTSS